MPDPVGIEFRRISDGVRMGRSLEDSMWDVTRRVDTPEFRFLIIAMAIQKETGGNLAETLGNLAELIRKRRQLRLKIRAMSAEARASAMIIGSLPFIMFTLLYGWSISDYVMTLFHTAQGQCSARLRPRHDHGRLDGDEQDDPFRNLTAFSVFEGRIKWKNFCIAPILSPCLAAAAAFAVVVLIWKALIENDPLPADRLKSVVQRRNELREVQQKKFSRRAALQRMSLMKQVVNWFKLARGKGFQDLRLKLARAGYRSRDAMFVFLFLKLVMTGGIGFVAAFFLFVLHVGKIAVAARVAGVMLVAAAVRLDAARISSSRISRRSARMCCARRCRTRSICSSSAPKPGLASMPDSTA